jgi:four helix bundle protein
MSGGNNMQDFRKLSVWEKSHLLVVAVYRTTSDFPPKEIFGLTSQIRRAGVSIPANIAEGCGRGGKAEYAHILRIAFGSASELEYHLLLANELTYLTPDEYDNLNIQVIEIKKMLTALVQKIEK